MEHYSDEFVLGLPDTLAGAGARVCKEFVSIFNASGISAADQYDLVLDTQHLLEALARRHGTVLPSSLEFDRSHPGGMSVFFEAMRNLSRAFDEELRRLRSQEEAERFERLLGQSFGYEMSEADVGRIQLLINQARDVLASIKGMTQDHRRRVLEKLEAVQRELHRNMSSLDRIYGLVGEAGVVLGKFGNDAKPFVDRVREILQIAWRSQAGAEGLPASAKQGLISPPETTRAEE